MIPKYVFDEMKRKAQHNLEKVKDEVIEKYKIKMNEEILPTFKREREKGNLIIDMSLSLDSYYLRCDEPRVQIHKHVECKWKNIEEINDKVNNLKSLKELKRKIEGLNKQYESWEMSMYKRIANGESISLPTFVV
jgi:hypothetical protein